MSKPVDDSSKVWVGVAILSLLALVVLAGSAAGHSVGLFYNPPAVTDGELYVTSADGHLYALGSDGGPRWTVDANAEITTHATVAGNSVRFGTGDGRVLAIDRDDGAVSWDRQLLEGRINSIAVGELQTYASAASTVAAVTRNGSIAWRFPTDGFVGAPVVAGDKSLYVAASRIQHRNGTLYALNTNGTLRWSRQTNETIEQVAAGDGVVYHTAGGRVVATAANGTQLWTVELSQVMAQPIVRNGTVVVGTISGTVAAIDGGEVTWRYRADLPVAPTVEGDTVYATTARSVIAIEDGTERWSQTIGATVLAPPTVGDHVYVGTQMNRTYALTPDGSFAWINRYSTTTADVPWADRDPTAEFWNPQGSVTRVVGPNGSVLAPETAESGSSGIVPAAAVFVVVSVFALGYGFWRRETND